MKRTTLFLTEELAANIKLFGVKSSKTNSEVMRQAITEFLIAKGYKPDQMPVVTYSCSYKKEEKT